jgi:hypothetical protein
MSKIEADKFELSYTAFDFKKMLYLVIDVFSFRLDEKQQRLWSSYTKCPLTFFENIIKNS